MDVEEFVFTGVSLLRSWGKTFRSKMNRKVDRRKVIRGPAKGLKVQKLSFHPHMMETGT